MRNGLRFKHWLYGFTINGDVVLELLGEPVAFHGQLQHSWDWFSLQKMIILYSLAISIAIVEHFEWAEILYV